MRSKRIRILLVATAAAGIALAGFLAGGLALKSSSAETERPRTTIIRIERVVEVAAEADSASSSDNVQTDTASEGPAVEAEDFGPVSEATPVASVTAIAPIVTQTPQVEAATPTPPEPEPTPENDPPYIVSISPADGSIGINPKANITVTFSEPMDKASAEAALHVTTGNCGSYTWNANGSVLTFDPCNDAAYGDEVEVTIYESAADKDGLGMEAEHQSSFRIIRKVTQTLTSQASLDGHVFGPQVLTLINPVVSSYTMSIGTRSRGFVSFDLSELPEDLLSIDSAQLRIFQSDHTAGVYGQETGRLMVHFVNYGGLDESDWNAAIIPFCNGICTAMQAVEHVLSDSVADGWKSANVTAAVEKAREYGYSLSDRIQFRVQFEKSKQTGPNIWAKFVAGDSAANQPALSVTYLVP